jgi:hypothetical protein
VFPGVGFHIQDRISRIRVGIAWLADAARVNDLAMTVQLTHLPVSWGNRFGVAVFADLFVNDGLVRVTDQAIRCFKMREIECRNQRL